MLQWYAYVTNTWFLNLKEILPKKVDDYKGIILYATKNDVMPNMKKNIYAESYTETLNAPMRWIPVAKEVGFERVELCYKYNKNIFNQDICDNVQMIVEQNIGRIDSNNIYKIVGTYDDMLIISIK